MGSLLCSVSGLTIFCFFFPTYMLSNFILLFFFLFPETKMMFFMWFFFVVCLFVYLFFICFSLILVWLSVTVLSELPSSVFLFFFFQCQSLRFSDCLYFLHLQHQWFHLHYLSGFIWKKKEKDSRKTCSAFTFFVPCLIFHLDGKILRSVFRI